MEEVLTAMTVPCLLVVGESDPRLVPMQKCTKQIAQATLISLPDCNHFASFVRSDLVLLHVTKFLGAVSRRKESSENSPTAN